MARKLQVVALLAAIGACIATAQTPGLQSASSRAERGIELQVVDPTGAGIPGAAISLTGDTLKGPISGTTDKLGEWQNRNIPPGEYTLRVMAPGFWSIKRNVQVDANSAPTLVIEMQIGNGGGPVVVHEGNPSPTLPPELFHIDGSKSNTKLPAFEVASIRRSEIWKGGGEGGSRSRFEYSPGGIRFLNVDLSDCLQWHITSGSTRSPENR